MQTIKEYRKRLGLTQKQVADYLGVTKSAVTMYETGARKPDIYTLKRLASFFQCSTDDLLKDI